jgi:hypothetical protein
LGVRTEDYRLHFSFYCFKFLCFKFQYDAIKGALKERESIYNE